MFTGSKIRAMREDVIIKPATSREQGDAEKTMGGGRIIHPEKRGVRREWTGFGEIVSVGKGGTGGSCFEQPELKPGMAVIYDTRCVNWEYTFNGENLVQLASKALVAKLDKTKPPGPDAIQALGWWALVEDENEKFAEFMLGPDCKIWRPDLAVTSFAEFTALGLNGGKIISLGKGTFLGPAIDIGKKARHTYTPEVVRSWAGDAEVGDRLAFSAQTAIGLRMQGREYYFASCASEIAGASAFVWSS